MVRAKKIVALVQSDVDVDDVVQINSSDEEKVKKDKKTIASDDDEKSDDTHKGEDKQVDAKTKKIHANIDKIIEMIKGDKTEAAIAKLETLKTMTSKKKSDKKRAPTAFNNFVADKMKELKESKMDTNMRMKECARLWKEQKNNDPNQAGK
jgi:hypothetical protein